MGCHYCGKWIEKGTWILKDGKFYHKFCLEEKEYKDNKNENCIACNDTGRAYWSDGVYGECLDCRLGADEN